jgi:hypothetical protein
MAIKSRIGSLTTASGDIGPFATAIVHSRREAPPATPCAIHREHA